MLLHKSATHRRRRRALGCGGCAAATPHMRILTHTRDTKHSRVCHALDAHACLLYSRDQRAQSNVNAFAEQNAMSIYKFRLRTKQQRVDVVAILRKPSGRACVCDALSRRLCAVCVCYAHNFHKYLYTIFVRRRTRTPQTSPAYYSRRAQNTASTESIYHQMTARASLALWRLSLQCAVRQQQRWSGCSVCTY